MPQPRSTTMSYFRFWPIFPISASSRIGRSASATVAHGRYADQRPVACITVGEVRQRFADRLDLADGVTAILDGTEAADDVRVNAGQVLMFVRHAGVKGRTP